MNEHQHDETRYRVAAETLESLALMFLVPEDEAANPLPCCARRVAVIFTGPFDGALILSASDGVLPELAANMLGLENCCAPTSEQQEDALKELANVICGNLLPVLAGEEAVFDVHAAELLVGGTVPATLGDRPPLAAARLHLDGGWADLALFAPEAVAAGAETAS